jgi:predicted neuraminidase
MRPSPSLVLVFASLALTASPARGEEPVPYPSDSTPAQPGLVLQEFVYGEVPFEQCHASTIAETPAGLVAAWFGGTEEGEKDVGIWFARHENGRWTEPVEVANGVQQDGARHPCWNPVLFQPEHGPLVLFYKVGPSPSTWWGMRITSGDGGRTWSKPQRLPDGILGPVKNKPVMVGTGLLCPSSSEHAGWTVHMEWTPDLGRTWHKTGPLNEGDIGGAIQPSILRYGERLQALCRSRGLGKIVEFRSDDEGRSWSAMQPISLPNPNSGLDTVTLDDGGALLVYNHTPRGRSPLNVALSDDGRHWQAALVLENQPGEYSYPAVIQTGEGLVHVTYTWKRRRIKHVILDPAKLELRAITTEAWPDR